MKKAKSQKNLTLPGEPISASAFKDMIKRAELVLFYSIAHVKAELNKLKTKYEI